MSHQTISRPRSRVIRLRSCPDARREGIGEGPLLPLSMSRAGLISHTATSTRLVDCVHQSGQPPYFNHDLMSAESSAARMLSKTQAWHMWL